MFSKWQKLAKLERTGQLALVRGTCNLRLWRMLDENTIQQRALIRQVENLPHGGAMVTSR
jgi:hypothetical protein